MSISSSDSPLHRYDNSIPSTSTSNTSPSEAASDIHVPLSLPDSIRSEHSSIINPLRNDMKAALQAVIGDACSTSTMRGCALAEKKYNVSDLYRQGLNDEDDLLPVEEETAVSFLASLPLLSLSSE